MPIDTDGVARADDDDVANAKRIAGDKLARELPVDVALNPCLFDIGLAKLLY